MTQEATGQPQAPWSVGAGSELELGSLLVGDMAENEKDILFLYEAVTWPMSMNFRQILQHAPLPSPFNISLSEWLNVSAGDPLGGINELYNIIQLNYNTLFSDLTSGLPSLSFDGRLSGFVCWHEKAAPSGGENEGYIPGAIHGGWVEGAGVDSFEL